MTTRVTVELPDSVFRRVESIARQSRRNVPEVVADFVARSVQPFPVDDGREAMLREVAAFRAMHPALYRDYCDQYVAIHEGRLVDHDPDSVALLKRVRQNFPGRVVLRRRVSETPDVVLHHRSPHLSSQP